MARPRLFDLMQSYPFWVFDADVLKGNLLFPILDPILGFSAVSSPEISIETKEVQPGNWEYKIRSVKTADVAPITLSRGTRFYDSDFYNWITKAVVGERPVRRSLIMVHFLGFQPISQIAAVAGRENPSTSFPDAGLVQLGVRLPGRAWVLHDALPIRYKSGSDFDAQSGEVSVQELEVQPTYIEEMSVSTLSPLLGRGFSIAEEVVEVVS